MTINANDNAFLLKGLRYGNLYFKIHDSFVLFESLENRIRFLRISHIYKVNESYIFCGTIYDSCESEYNKIYVFPTDIKSYIKFDTGDNFRSYEEYNDNKGSYMYNFTI